MRPDDVIGHAQQRLAFRKLIEKKALPHALLFAGPPGVGKSCVARELARRIICAGESEREQIFDAGNCPDFYLRNCSNSEEASTANIRELLSSLSFQSFSGGARVVLLNDAEALTPQALNALLKILEEPRAGLFFILVSSNAPRLLATITSRCQVWQFSELSSSQVASVLENHPDILGTGLDRSRLPLLTELAAGSLADISFLYDNLDRLEEISSRLQRLANGDSLLALEIAQELGKNKESLAQEISLLSRVVRRIMLSSTTDYRSRWDSLLSDLLQLDWLIFERNLNPTIALQQTLLEFSRNARSPNFANSYPGILAHIV